MMTTTLFLSLLLLVPTQPFHIATYNKKSVHSMTAKSASTNVPTTLRVGEVSSKPLDSAAKPVVKRPKWGTDPNEVEQEYWYDQRIHTLGNVGLSGALHAALAPASTKLIDVKAYEGVDVRGKLAEQLASLIETKNNLVRPRVVDLCCGVGFSTRALQRAFPWAESIMGVDTSEQMIAMANFISDHEHTVSPYFGRNLYHRLYQNAATTAKRVRATFVKANAEDTQLPAQQFDLVTVMYAFHEAPRKGRDAILREARRLLKPSGTLAVVDISTEYKPSPAMLSGEPYVEDYQKQIHGQLNSAPGFEKPVFQTVIPHHLSMWTLRRSSPMLSVRMR